MTSPWLGDMAVEPGKGYAGEIFSKWQRPAYAFRRLNKGDGHLALDLIHWAWAWQQAFDSHAGSRIHHEAVRLDPMMLMPTTSVFARTFTTGGKRITAYHQCIHPNTRLTIGAELVKPSPYFLSGCSEEVEQPDTEQIMEALRVIGVSLGISSYQSHQGYGRFVPLEIQYHETCGGRVGRKQSECVTDSGQPAATAQGGGEIDRAGRD